MRAANTSKVQAINEPARRLQQEQLQYSPADSARTGEPAKADKPRSLRATSSGIILVADDDAIVRRYVMTVLKEQGYQVLEAENGRKALEQCASFPGIISALITDAVMPELNGRELAEKALQMRPNLKVVLMSGYVDRGLKEDDPSNPTYAFLQKPFPSETLIDTVESLCTSANRASR